MTRNNIVFLVIIVLILLLAAGGVGVYYYLPLGISQPSSSGEKEQEQTPKERYPDVVKGTIIFSDEKVTVKTDDNKEYWLWPPQLPSYYERKGIKDGQSIEVKGMIITGERILVGLLK